MLTRTRAIVGFTLLELLVVVAVIALLLAILIPALTTGLEAGRAAVCGSNLSQLANGSLNYAQEHDQTLPLYARRGIWPPGSEWWVSQVARTMDDLAPEVFRCPNDPIPLYVPIYIRSGTVYMNDSHVYSYSWGSSMDQAPNERPKRSEHSDGRTITLPVTYRGFCDFSFAVLDDPSSRGDPTDTYGPAMGGWNWYVRKVTEFANPGNVALMGECVNENQYKVERWNQRECLSIGLADQLLGKKSTKFASWKRHFGTTNLSFLDGHVEKLTPQAIGQVMAHWEDRLLPHHREQYRNLQGQRASTAP